jgi:hypothetical protein
MHLEIYDLTISKDVTRFDFISEGQNGKIEKVVFFTSTHIKNFYNLSLCDVDKDGEISDLSVSNNQDTEKLLATVASCVIHFTNISPNSYVYAEGSTPSRTRLYRMGLNKYFDEIYEDFHILGLKEEQWFKFEKNKDYEGFLV